jgi:hypothetical protein
LSEGFATDGFWRRAADRMMSVMERPLMAAGSTDRCNTFRELLCLDLMAQSLSRPFMEQPCNCAELSLAMQGQIGATRKMLAQQSVLAFV